MTPLRPRPEPAGSPSAPAVPVATLGAWDDLEDPVTPLEDFDVLERWRNADLGVSLRFDHPAGVSEADCLGFVEHRRNTNLAVPAANETMLRNWAADVEAAERSARRDGSPLALPPPAATRSARGHGRIRLRLLRPEASPVPGGRGRALAAARRATNQSRITFRPAPVLVVLLSTDAAPDSACCLN